MWGESSESVLVTSRRAGQNPDYSAEEIDDIFNQLVEDDKMDAAAQLELMQNPPVFSDVFDDDQDGFYMSSPELHSKKTKMDALKSYVNEIDFLKHHNMLGKSLPQNVELDPTVKRLLREFAAEGIHACVAGGYVSWLLKKTSEFTDVDIFICSELPKFEAFQLIGKRFHGQFSVRTWKEEEFGNYPKDTMLINHIISVTGDFGTAFQEIQFIFTSTLVFNDMGVELFAFEVLENFDLALCKTGIFWNSGIKKPDLQLLNLAVSTKKYLREMYAKDVKAARLAKYKRRDQVKSFCPNGLKSLCLSAILKTGAEIINDDREAKAWAEIERAQAEEMKKYGYKG